MKLLFHKWLTFLTVSVLSHHNISDVCLKWSHFPSPTTWYTKSHLSHIEKSWPILVFTFWWQTDTWYWWHCTVTMTNTTIQCSSCLQKENKAHFNVLFKCTCEIYWFSKTVSYVTPCAIFLFNIHVTYTDFPKLYHMSLHVQYSCSVHVSDILMFGNCITCQSMYNILVQYTHQIFCCYETVSHINPCTIFLFNIHVRYTDVMKLYHISIHVQYSCSIYTSDILMLWNCVTYHSMYNILVQYICQIYWYCLMYHMSLNVQYSCSICMSDILMFWKCITYHSMYNILLQYRCQIYWYYETVSHVTPCIIFNGDVSRPRTTALRITMLCDNYVPYNGNIIAANNIYISCKINSCSLPH